MDPIQQLQNEVHRSNAQLHDVLEMGFQGVNARLDVLNNRVYAGEHELASQASAITELKQRVVPLESATNRPWRDRGTGAAAGGLLALAFDYLPDIFARLFK